MAVASNNAILNIGRLNAFRLNYIDPALKKQRDALTITLDGVPLKVRLGSLSIHDVINDAPNTCTLTVDAATPPTVGGRLRVVLGTDPQYQLFIGRLQAARQSYVGRAHVDVWDCEAIDDTQEADWIRPFAAYENMSATAAATALLQYFAPGYSTAGIQPGLPPVTLYLDGSERVAGALRLIAKLIGGYYYFDSFTLHLFQGDEPGVANPDDVTGAGLLEDPRLTATSDDSQLRTRCYGKGHGEATLAAVNAGETLVPLATAVMFNALGGLAISEWQRLTYTGVSTGGTGALIGPGVTPSAPPVVALAAGTGIDPGAHTWAYTWVTAAGETRPSPVASLTIGPLPSPTVAPTFLAHGGITGYDNVDPLSSGAWHTGETVELGYSWAASSDPATFTPMSPTISVVAQLSPYWYHTPGDSAKSLYFNAPCSADPAIKYVVAWHRVNGGPWYWWLGSPNTPGSTVGVPFNLMTPAAYAHLGTPASGVITIGRVALSGVSTGPAGVTARKIYRTAANQTPLKLLATWADNTTTSGLDVLADSTLGVAPPVTDSSGLTMPAGQVLPGTPTVPVSGTGWALPAGGWAILGNGEQVIRYTGISGNTLTGIPASGSGSLTAAVNYNTTITGAPMLLGVNYYTSAAGAGLLGALRLGAPVHLFVQVDDPGAQSALAARYGGTGVIEHLIVDERRGEPSLRALCTADLAQYSRPIVTVQYTTFDPKSRSGRPVRVHLTQPAIDQTLMIQAVTITTGPGRPRYAVTASSVRTSLEDLLRRMVGTLDEGF